MQFEYLGTKQAGCLDLCEPVQMSPAKAGKCVLNLSLIYNGLATAKNLICDIQLYVVINIHIIKTTGEEENLSVLKTRLAAATTRQYLQRTCWANGSIRGCDDGLLFSLKGVGFTD